MYIRVLMQKFLLMCILVLANTSIGNAQLTAAGSVSASVTNSDDFYRDRETFGVRYRTPQLVEMGYQAPLKLQIGLLTTNENGLFPSKSGAGIRHWAVGLEQSFNPKIKASIIYGRFIEQRSVEREHINLPAITYYQLVAVGTEITTSDVTVTFEKLLAHPKTVHIGLHTFIARLRTHPADIMIQHIKNSPDQLEYQFWSASTIVRPLYKFEAPWKWVGVEGGWRPIPSYTEDRSVNLRFLNVGMYWGGIVQ